MTPLPPHRAQEALEIAARTIDAAWEAYLEGTPDLLDAFERAYHEWDALGIRVAETANRGLNDD